MEKRWIGGTERRVVGRMRGFALLSNDLFLVKVYHLIFKAEYTEKGPQATSRLWCRYKGWAPVFLSTMAERRLSLIAIPRAAPPAIHLPDPNR